MKEKAKAQKPRGNTTSPARDSARPRESPLHQSKAAPLVSLQQRIGNQAMIKLLRSSGVQTKLRVSEPQEADEVEADRISEQVVTTHGAPEPPEIGSGGQKISRAPEAAPSATSVSADAASLFGHLGPGEPLDPGSLRFFAPRFGTDFSGVRVHSSEKAARAADALDARAFTLGSHIAFGSGEYSPGTVAGQKLLAHELTHVVQQRGGANVVQRQAAIATAVLTPFLPTDPLLRAALLGFIEEAVTEAVVEGKAKTLVAHIKDMLTSFQELNALNLAFQVGTLAGVISPVTALFDLAVFAEHMQTLASQLLVSALTGASALAGDALNLAMKFAIFNQSLKTRVTKWVKEHPEEIKRLLLPGGLSAEVQKWAEEKAHDAGQAVAKKVWELLESPFKPEAAPEKGVLDILGTQKEGESVSEPLGLVSSKIERVKSYALSGPGARIGYELGYAVGFVVINIALIVVSDGIGNLIAGIGEALGKLAPALRGVGELIEVAGSAIAAIEEVLNAATKAILKPFEELLAPLNELLGSLRTFLRRLLGLSKEAGAETAELLGQAAKRELPPAPPARETAKLPARGEVPPEHVTPPKEEPRAPVPKIDPAVARAQQRIKVLQKSYEPILQHDRDLQVALKAIQSDLENPATAADALKRLEAAEDDLIKSAITKLRETHKIKDEAAFADYLRKNPEALRDLPEFGPQMEGELQEPDQIRDRPPGVTKAKSRLWDRIRAGERVDITGFENPLGEKLNIDPNFRPGGPGTPTNRELAAEGRACYLNNGDRIELHHRDQNPFGPLDEHSESFHGAVGEDPEFHPETSDPGYISWRNERVIFEGQERNLGDVYNTLRRRYWMARFQ